MEMLRTGAADIAQTGISRSLIELDSGREDAPLHIAEINSRDGFFLVQRSTQSDASQSAWDWRSLEGASIAPVGFTPVPWNSLRAAMLLNGVNIRAVNLVSGLSAQDAMDRLRAGDVDYVHLPHPQAALLESEGVGRVAVALGPQLGHICYSSFAAMPDFVEAHGDIVQAFVNGFADALSWLSAADYAQIVASVAPFFHGVDSRVLLHCIRQYRSSGTWPQSPSIERDAFDRMRDILIDGGLVSGRHRYERLARAEFAATAHARIHAQTDHGEDDGIDSRTDVQS